MGKVLVGALVAGIVVFFWGAISHMALPIGTMGVRQIPGEEKVVAAMKDSIREPGFYFFPGHDMSKAMSESEAAGLRGEDQARPHGGAGRSIPREARACRPASC